MLSFKEFVFASWQDRGYPTGVDAENSWKHHKEESNGNGWWVRYNAWLAHGSPMPVQDINYDLKPVQKMLTFEEFFVAQMKATILGIDWTFEEHFPKQLEQHVTSWKTTYKEWIEDGCPPIVSKFATVQQKPVPEKKKIRYLNRVNA